MQIVNSLLAQAAPETTQQINEIYQRIATQPQWAFNLMWALPAAIFIIAVAIFLRQKKIAQNQVYLARLIDQLLQKK